ncbi:MAG: monovalent cation:proton antiporter-2 (CPA2) family protein [Burkholderiales bacterium]
MHGSLEITLILLVAAVLTVTLFRRLNLPPMLGYLALGIVAGPHALGFVPESAETTYLAEFGVVFLMFSIGLEFSLPQLVSMRRVVFGLGGAQVVVTLLVFLAASLLFGLSWQAGLALGGALAMSSTAIISKTLAEKLQLNSPHGRQTMGVLLFQDLAVVPLLVLIPALSQDKQAMAATVAYALVKALIILIFLLFVGQRLMRRWFHLVARAKSSELFVLNVLMVTLGLAYLTDLAGLSLALGAFLAGILISETEYRYQVEDYIKPFRDVLLGLFFVTIGMLLDVNVVLQNFLWVMALLLFLIVIKTGIVFGLARAFRNDTSVSMRCALALGFAGEFGFVLLSLASTNALLSEQITQIVLAAMLLSMMLSPLILMHSDRIVLKFSKSEWMLRAMALTELSAKSMAAQSHVIICGYGRSGQSLARFLEQEKISVIALDVDPARVKQAAAAGDSVVYGDASRREVLMAAGLARASALVVSLADTKLAEKILAHVQALRPELPVIVRTYDDTDLEHLRLRGATEIVPEVLEGSMMLATHTMLLLGLPLAHVLRRMRDMRAAQYQLVRGFFHGATDIEADMEDATQARLQSIMLNEDAAAVGKTLKQLSLDDLYVEVTAVRRHNVRNMNPAPDMRLEKADVLILLGAPENLAQAEIRLLQG